MKLTKNLRAAFIRAVMQDVPQVDYTELLRTEVTKRVHAGLPKEIQAALKSDVASEYIVRGYMDVGGNSIALPMPKDMTSKWRSSGIEHPALSADDRKFIRDTLSKKATQDEKLKTLREKLEAAAGAATTRKALLELLPEFERYLPEETAKALRTLPVVQNVVSDFVKAGWPKGKKAGAK